MRCHRIYETIYANLNLCGGHHAIGTLGGKCLLVHTYPDPNDESRPRAISLREAIKNERRRYQEGEST